MKRDKQWWAGLDFYERSSIVTLERANRHYGSGAYLPEGYTDCSNCSTPTSGGGLCSYCSSDLDKLIKKADEQRTNNSKVEGVRNTDRELLS